jgi:hypothetical protein
MTKTEDANKDLHHITIKLLPGLVSEAKMWGTHFDGKRQGFLDS